MSKKTISQITSSTLLENGIVSLSDRPNDSIDSGGDALTASQLKAKFDSLSNIAATKINEIITKLAGTDSTDYLGITITGNSDLTSLGELLTAMQDGSFASSVMTAKASASASTVQSLQTIINTMAQKIAILDTSDVGEIDEDLTSLITTVSTLSATVESYHTALVAQDTAETARSNTAYGTSISLELDSNNYKIRAILKNANGSVISTSDYIDLPLESVVVSGTYNSTTKNIDLTLTSGGTISFSVSDLVGGLVNESRTVNGKALSGDITLSVSDITGGSDILSRLSSLEDDTSGASMSDVNTAVASEASLRSGEDTTLQTNINAEVSARTEAVNSLTTQMSGKESTSNKVTSVSSSSTDTEYPSAKAVYDKVLSEATARDSADTNLQTEISALDGEKEDVSNKKTSINTLPSSASDSYYPTEKAVSTALQDIREIATGRTETFVVSCSSNAGLNTQNASVTVSSLTDTEGTVIEPIEVKVGDVVLVTDTNVPDRWVSAKTSAFITLAKLETIPQSTFVFCTYNETTYGDISTILAGTKMPVLNYSNTVYYLSGISSTAYTFVSVVNGTEKTVTCSSASVWSNGSTAIETSENKVTSLSASSTDTQYPSAKAVFDAVNGIAKGYTFTITNPFPTAVKVLKSDGTLVSVASGETGTVTNAIAFYRADGQNVDVTDCTGFVELFTLYPRSSAETSLSSTTVQAVRLLSGTVAGYTWALTVTTDSHISTVGTVPSDMATGEDSSLTLTFAPASGYALPSAVSVTNATTSSWNRNTGALTIANPTGNVAVSASSVKVHTITPTISPSGAVAEDSSNVSSVLDGEDATLSFTAGYGYRLTSDSISGLTGATNGGWTLSGDTEANTGTLVLQDASADISFTVTAKLWYNYVQTGSQLALADAPYSQSGSTLTIL